MRYFRQVVFREEGTGIQLLILQLDLPTGIIGNKTDHKVAWIRPRLIAKISDVTDRQSCFLPHFTLHALFQRLPRFQEAGHKPMKRSPEVTRMHQQDFLTFPDQDQYGRRYRREHLIAATGTFLHDRPFQFRRRPADRTKPAVLIPIDNLIRFPRLIIGVTVDMIIGSAESHRHENIRLFQGRIGKSRHRHCPVLHLDRKRAGNRHRRFVRTRDYIAFSFLLQ